MKTIKSLSWYVLLLLPLSSIGQQVEITPANLPDDITIAAIVGMTQDNHGYIWMASHDGLFKYDGLNIESFKPDLSSSNSISGLRLECVFADSKGNIWIGTFRNGLDKYDPEMNRFTHFQHNKNDSNSIRSNLIKAIAEDQEGDIWIGTQEGLDMLKIKTGEFHHFKSNQRDAISLSREHVRALYVDRAGTIWVGCGSTFFGEDELKLNLGGLYRLDKKTGSVKRFVHDDKNTNTLIDNRVRAIFEDSHGVFWVGTAGDGLHIMDRKKETFQRCLYDPKNPQKLSRPPVKNSCAFSPDHITFINEDAQGQIWIGTYCGGINRYNPASGEVRYFGTDAKEPFKTKRNNFWYSLKTKDSLLWLSTWNPSNNAEAVSRISVTPNKIPYSKIGKTVFSFAQDERGIMWFGTDRGLIRQTKENVYDSFFVNEDKTIPKNTVTYLENAAGNNFWVSSYSGLYSFNNVTKILTSYVHNKDNINSIICDTVMATAVDNSNKLWIGTIKGLDLMDMNTGSFKHFLNNPYDSTTLSSNTITVIKKNKAGNIWIGTNNSGNLDASSLNRYNVKTGKFTRYIKKNALIHCIYEDSRNRLWVSTFSSGLFVYNPVTDKFLLYNDSTGYINNNTVVYGITEDLQHNLWLNTNNGLMKLNPETKIAVIFGKSWGLISYNLRSPGFTSVKGEIFFGEQKGYYHFFPGDLTKNVIPNPFISKFYLGKNIVLPGEDKLLPFPLSQTEKIILTHKQNNFAFEFNSVDFITIGSDKNVQYKLENYDDVWRKAGSENSAVYYKVPPGRYVFHVRASNLYGNWGEKSIGVIIYPPWYKTWWAYLLFGLVALGILRTYIVYRSRKLKRENKILEEKVNLRTKQLRQSIEELKTAEAQLIQSAKMASLGELTAGIAHEIQNPLNFVNNFSEVSNELLVEMKTELVNNNKEDAIAIADDVKQNLEKILHHGKRADGIVKGMLQHSRGSSGVKEPTDINKLADEYLRLSYHGLRAKDTSFNAKFETDFDPTIEKINVVPQDLGQVILNLINNAFYTVDVKKKQSGNRYEPTVLVSTKKGKDKVEIRVTDNGNGIPQKVLDKIFQPFFTTKPTGQGTGLGLSLAYDIIKANGGELKVETTEGQGAEFIIQLPVV